MSHAQWFVLEANISQNHKKQKETPIQQNCMKRIRFIRPLKALKIKIYLI